MSVAVQRLSEGTRAVLKAHFLALPAEDLRLRFGTTLSTDGIAAYVDGIDFDRDAVFGVYDDDLALTGAAHVAFGDSHAELGVSVLPGHRGRGLGSALFERAARHAQNRFIPTMFMHCLSENVAIMHIARKSGMVIVVDTGEADAHLQLPPASPASITGEYVTNRLALYDYALKAQVATWKGINSAWEPPAT